MTRSALHFPLTRASPVIGFNMPTGACVSGSKIKPAWCRFEKCWGGFLPKRKNPLTLWVTGVCFNLVVLHLYVASQGRVSTNWRINIVTSFHHLAALVASVINISSPFISTGTTPQWEAIQKSDWSWKVSHGTWREVPGKGDSFLTNHHFQVPC